MLRLIIQTKRKYKKKTQTNKNEENGEEEKANHRDSDDETAEGSSTNTDCDQDSDVSFMKDSDEGRMDWNTQKNETPSGNEDCIASRRAMDKESSNMGP